jgi:hypothetical protein
MRFRLLSLLAVCAFFLTFTSCIEEGSQDLLLSSESGTTQLDIDNGTEAISKMAFAYLHEDRSAIVPGELSLYSLSFTARDVKTGDRLTGTSDMMIVYLMSQNSEISGEYVINANEATAEKGIAYVTYCTNMNFARGTADDDVPMVNGSLIITPAENGDYLVAYQGQVGRMGQAEGSLEGAFVPVRDN